MSPAGQLQLQLQRPSGQALSAAGQRLNPGIPVPVTVVRTVRNLGPVFLQALNANGTTVAALSFGGNTLSPMAFAGWQAEAEKNATSTISSRAWAVAPRRRVTSRVGSE